MGVAAAGITGHCTKTNKIHGKLLNDSACKTTMSAINTMVVAADGNWKLYKNSINFMGNQ